MRKCTKRWLLPVFAAAMTLSAGFSSLAEETVKVTVPNVKGGYLEVSYEKDGCTFYLPVGETVAVPKGTELAVNAVGVQSITSDEEWIDSVPQSVTINGAALEEWSPTADTDLKFDAVFKGKLSDTYDTAEYGLEAIRISFNSAENVQPPLTEPVCVVVNFVSSADERMLIPVYSTSSPSFCRHSSCAISSS